MRVVSVLLLWLLTAGQTARADDEVARQRFESGVAASEEARWQDAAYDFEASLSESDRPATRFNLILAYQQLGRPLDVVRHALQFLAEQQGAGREEARSKVAATLAEAKRQVAVLNVAALPSESELRVNGHVPALLVAGNVYLLPGVHHLELRLGQAIQETIEITLSAGQELPWPRLGRRDVEPTSAGAPRTAAPLAPLARRPMDRAATDSPLAVVRNRAAWTLGSVGAALAVAAGACLIVADRRSDRLRDSGVARTQEAGYFDALDRYWTSVDSVMPLAFSGGVLMASAILVGERVTRRGSLAWSVASLAAGAALVGVGTFWLVREPHHVIPGTDIERPSRQGGSLLFSAGLPLITYGAAFPIVHRRGRRLSAGLSTVRFAW